MLVTPTGEVLIPGAADDMFVLLNQAKGFGDFMSRKSNRQGEFNPGLEPELRFTALTLNMNVYSRLFA